MFVSIPYEFFKLADFERSNKKIVKYWKIENGLTNLYLYARYDKMEKNISYGCLTHYTQYLVSNLRASLDPKLGTECLTIYAHTCDK